MVRIVDGRRITVYRSGLVGLLGLKTCGVGGIGQVAKLLGARAEVRVTRALGSGKARRRRCVRSDHEGTTRMAEKHENRDSKMEICDMHTANTLSHA